MATEHWQSGPVPGVPGVLQPVAHALLQARDDVAAAAGLVPEVLWAAPAGAASVGWHLLHLAGSTDRLLACARGAALDEAQRAALAEERELPAARPTAAELVARVARQVDAAIAQLRETPEADLDAMRELGRARVPVTVRGLLFHAAEHAARHAGQVVTTLKLVAAGSASASVRTVLLRDLASLAREIEAYPDDEAPWQPVPGVSNVAGTLALHCAGNLQHFVGACLGGRGYRRDREAEFSRRGVPRAELVAELGRASTVVGEVLAALPSARLGEPFPADFQGKTLPTERFLVHLATHLAYHLGQVDYHRRMVTGQGALAGVVGVPV